jgi:uncharacterized protein YbaR (Trm112 family)
MLRPFGFPREFVTLIRCPADAGQLAVKDETRSEDDDIAEGELHCATCAHVWRIEGGIARLMKEGLTEENEHELVLKDQEYEAMPEVFTPPLLGWRSKFMDRVEIPPHLTALHPLDGRRVLEIGCGDGRFTMLMAQSGANILAVDISIGGLRGLKRNFQAGTAPTTYKIAPSRRRALGRLGLVQAEATALRVAPHSFDRAMSATPLDSRDERLRMYNAVAEALTDDGRYVAGVEYDDFGRRLLGLPRLRRYSPGGILIEHLDIPGMRREIGPFFRRVRMRLVRANVPFVKRMRLPMAVHVAASLTCAVLPGFKHLGQILMVRAERPIRLPVEGAMRRDYFGARALYRRYKRWRGEEPTWDWQQPV